MSRVAQAAKQILRRIDLFSTHVLKMPLYGYQARPLQAIIDSVLNQRGDEFLLVFPRQSGKNEAVAHLLVYLLNILSRVGGSIVFAAIGDGVGRGLRRLEERLDNAWNAGKWRRGARPTRRQLGRAAVVFLSSHPGAFSRGETAHWLLVIDELQDNEAGHIEAVFEPMRAANNATALYIGTVRFSSDALWQKKVQLEALQRADGRQRVWLVSPDEVSADNANYGRFLAGKIRQLGQSHPIIQSEYFLKPIDAEGGLFPARRQRLMRGAHARQAGPVKGKIYVATVDVGGQDEATTDPIAQLDNPARDYTVCHIFELDTSDRDAPGPTYRAVDVWVDHGSRHFQSVAGKPALVHRLLAYLRSWNVSHIVADATGVGEGLCDWLASSFGQDRVTQYKFSRLTKAQLGAGFLSVVETGRFQYWSGEDEPLSDGWWFWQQCGHCIYEIKPGGTWERDLQWAVPASARVDTPAGMREVHDDRLISAALVSVYDELVLAGALRTGRGEAAVIKGRDPLEGMGF